MVTIKYCLCASHHMASSLYPT